VAAIELVTELELKQKHATSELGHVGDRRGGERPLAALAPRAATARELEVRGRHRAYQVGSEQRPRSVLRGRPPRSLTGQRCRRARVGLARDCTAARACSSSSVRPTSRHRRHHADLHALRSAVARPELDADLEFGAPIATRSW